MFIINFLRFLSGYLVVSFSGEFAERLLNICAKNRLTVWNIKKKDGKIYVNIGIKSFKKLRYLKRKCSVKVKVVRRHGIRFILSANRLRFGVIVGVAVYFVIIVYLSGFIWNIDICSNEPVDSERIMYELKNIGITKGIRKSKIDTENQRVELIMSVDNLSWAALNIEGTNLSVDVNVSESVDKKDTTPSNLVAAKDGVIKRILVTEGNTLVTVDQTVLKGDMLVTGIIEDKMGNISLKHSGGEVFAQTKETVSISVPFNQKHTVKTGKTVKKRVLEFFNIKLPLFLGTVKFEHEKKVNNYELKIFGKSMPINLYSVWFYETKEVSEIIDKELAQNIAFDKFTRQISNKNYVKYEVADAEILENADGITVNYVVIGEENIARQENLSFSTTNYK